MAVKLERVEGHPGIYRRGGRYVAVGRDHHGRQVKRFAKTIKEAELAKADIRLKADRRERQQRSKVAFADYARDWIAKYDGRGEAGIEAHTRADYEKHLEHAIAYFGRTLLCDIEPADVKEYMRHVAARVATRGPNAGKPVSKNTVRLALAPVKAMFADAREEGIIRDNPAHAVRLPRVRSTGDGRRKAISQRELALLLSKLPEEWRLFFAFLAHTGLRIGEAIELRWSDVDLGRGVVNISRRFYLGDIGDPKTANGIRTITLTTEMGQALWRLRGDAAADDLVFTTETGRRISPSNLTSRVLKPALRAAGVDERISFHSFRHTTGSLLYDAGYNDVEVQHWLGHANPSFTKDVYVHPLAEEQRAPAFMDGVASVADLGNARATRAAETGRGDGAGKTAQTA
jgi:integrase